MAHSTTIVVLAIESSDSLKRASTSRRSRPWQCAWLQCHQPTASPGPGAQTKEAERVAAHIQVVTARHFSCAADAEAAIADYEGRSQGRRGRRPKLWRIIPSAIASRRSPNEKSAHTVGGLPKRSRSKKSSAIASSWQQRRWSGRSTIMSGPSSRRQSVQQYAPMPIFSDPITSNTRPWKRGSAGSRTGSDHASVAGETGTDRRVSDAHGGWVTRLCLDSAPGPALPATPSSSTCQGTKASEQRPRLR
jgi:hypothetical protein